MNQKYELLQNDTKNIFGITLFRIKAKISFLNVLKGDLGGYIEKEENLNVSGNAWVYGNAWVSGNAWVYGNARVYGNAWVYGNARVYGNAWVYDDARVYGNAWVYDDAQVYGNARVSGNARFYGNAWVYGNAQVYGNARVYGNAWVYGNAQVYGNARVYGNAWILTGYVTLSLNNISFSLIAQLGIALVKDKCILYKRVNKISKGKYSSCYNKNFIYQDGKIAKVKNPDLSQQSCSSGIHLSTVLYWKEGNTLIACEVKKEDIITVQEGKVRVKQCKVIGEVEV